MSIPSDQNTLKEPEIFPFSSLGSRYNSNSNAHITHGTDINPKAEKQLLRKCDVRLVPFTAWLYLLAHLDRTNVGNAKILGR
jgi:hypothetical protein